MWEVPNTGPSHPALPEFMKYLIPPASCSYTDSTASSSPKLYRRLPLRFRFSQVILLCAVLAAAAMAQQAPHMSVETSQPLFSVMAALNACGYDAGLSDSLPLRAQIRGEVLKAAQSEQAQKALRNLCAFYQDHQRDTAPRTLSDYISLALNMSEGPKLELRTSEANLPPDAIFVYGFTPLLQHFSEAVDLNAIWLRHQTEYNQLIRELHNPVNNTIVSTDLYLKRSLSGYLKHDFIVYVEPQIPPAEVNSRNYAEDYYVVISPSSAGAVRLDQVRHVYLHYILDAKAASRGTTLQRLTPLLESVKRSSLEDSYRFDIGLLMTESLIKAIEARQIGGPKGDEKPRKQAVWDATRQGFILTDYFYKQLVDFEKDEVGFDQAYADWLHDINVDEQKKVADTVPFVQSSTTELVHRGRRKEMLVELAERALASGNFDGAKNYAQQSLAVQEDPGRALFVLARVAVAGGKMGEAQGYFERAVESSADPKIRGWSHVYLGRILDLQEHRQEAVAHYHAALDAGGSPELKAAAEKGLQEAYHAPAKAPSD